MTIHTDSVPLSTRGYSDMHDITGEIGKRLKKSGLRRGTVTIFVSGSTAGLTTIEFEPGLVRDLKDAFEKIAPEDGHYQHHARWGDDNGNSHVRASMLGPSLVVPFVDGRLQLGTWQQIVLVDFDTGPRKRNVLLQFMGE